MVKRPPWHHATAALQTFVIQRMAANCNRKTEFVPIGSDPLKSVVLRGYGPVAGPGADGGVVANGCDGNAGTAPATWPLYTARFG